MYISVDIVCEYQKTQLCQCMTAIKCLAFKLALEINVASTCLLNCAAGSSAGICDDACHPVPPVWLCWPQCPPPATNTMYDVDSTRDVAKQEMKLETQNGRAMTRSVFSELFKL